MNKALVAVVAVLLVTAGAGAVWYFRGGDEVAMTRSALMGSGAATCTFVDPDTDEEGTLYIRDGDMRMSMMTVASGTPGLDPDEERALSHVLMKDEQVYMWSVGETEGIVMPANQSDQDGQILADDYEDEEQFREAYVRNQFSCSRGASADLFEVPEDVEFIDYSDLFELPQGLDSGPSPELTEEELEELERQFEQN